MIQIQPQITFSKLNCGITWKTLFKYSSNHFSDGARSLVRENISMCLTAYFFPVFCRQPIFVHSYLASDKSYRLDFILIDSSWNVECPRLLNYENRCKINDLLSKKNFRCFIHYTDSVLCELHSSKGLHAEHVFVSQYSFCIALRHRVRKSVKCGRKWIMEE